MHDHTDKSSLRTYARIAGVLYLVIIVCAGFSEGFVRSSLIVPGDADGTVANIMASEMLYRIGFVCDLIAFMSDAAVAVLLYVLLRPVSKPLSMVAASFRLLAHPAIATVNLLNHFAVLLLLRGSEYLSAFAPEQLNALVMVMLNAHHYGYLIGGAFFGIHCLLLGYLLTRSDLFPGWLGVLLIVAAFGYLIESFGGFLFPGHEAVYLMIVLVPASVAELSLCGWLLIKGVRSVPRDTRFR